MPNANRAFSAFLATLALPSCFSPIVEPLDSEGASSSATDPGESSTGPGTDTTADGSSSGAVDSTGATDTPPEITAFTVDGSIMPAEQQVAGMVIFDVDAVDDVGIDHVELYDDGELIATLDSSPWRTEILVSSADNGSHSYTAVAYDTVGQTDESDVVPMSVNVIGGEILELRQDIADFRVTPPLVTFPRISASAPTDLLITASFREDVPLDPRYGITAISYSDTLSRQWSDDLLPMIGGTHGSFLNGDGPAPSVTMPGRWLLGGAMYGDGMGQRAVFSIDEVSQSISDVLPVGPSNEFVPTPVTTDLSGNVVLSPSTSTLDKRPTPNAMPSWSIPIGDGNAVVFHAFTDGDDIVITLFEANCAPMAMQCAQRLSQDGMVLWTRPITSMEGSAAAATMSPDGHLALSTRTEDDLLRLLVLDRVGDTVTDEIVAEDSIYLPLDMSYDPQGSLLIAGHHRTDSDDTDDEAWAARVDENGELLWLEVYSFDVDHGITGITATPTGKAYAVGWENSFDHDLFGFSGHGWVAELAL
ncbi:Ig-like domain-containing protein [Paraliomyxa miuraensis]|uniref:Ig-like domain-containing protein n=1 Tax=Paraliomyxa miuraensis TaxID=376150 RepID=UPI00225374B5|nr:Ig-like domain-containing protein [Paraliomyxa miuraensis]MCX4245069.1 Ig-like domain-containing protein [Paraliomyxa miuraensis]